MTIVLTAGCATIAPRNVLPQASAGRTELEGFHTTACIVGHGPDRNEQQSRRAGPVPQDIACLRDAPRRVPASQDRGAGWGKDYNELHVDGGVTRQVFIAPSIFSSAPHDHSPGTLAVKPRLYIIRNGKIDPEWQSVSENVFAITQRSISTLIKNQSIGDLYRIYSVTKRDGIDFNLASIPADFTDRSNEPLDQKYMISLFKLGYDLASRGYSWVKAPPGMELAIQAHN